MHVKRHIGRRLTYVVIVLALLVSTAEGGLRAAKPLLLPRLPPFPPDSARSVLCVGDSVTQGIGTDESRDPWPMQLRDRLKAAHVQSTTVVPLGRAGAGAGADYVRDVVYPVVASLPSSSRPLAVVMLGHNDFLVWDDYADQLKERPDLVGRPRGAGSPLAIVRVFRWVMSGDQRPHVEIDSFRLANYHRVLGDLRDRVRERGGEMWLSTYLIPGAPTAGMEPTLAEVVGYARSGETLINDEIRGTAALLGLPLIDLETIIPVAADFDPAVFTDQIHLTPAGLGLVAEAIGDRLIADGVLAD
ncbi:MAG: SGNH/GDSL hydrolase family protein [Myxococcales bacterium]|nr:SGNH/GDSL hydrolase family protein [Myxococcales bacterium]